MSADSASRRTGGTILVVDDETVNLELMTDVLEREGYTVLTAANGEEALVVFKHARPDVALLDVQMPGISGFEVCRRIKENPATRLTPVVIVTGLYDRVHRLTGIDAGADDFLSKPFDVDELRARVRSLMRLKRYTDDLESAESVILSLARTVEARDPHTEGHCERLAGYATVLGQDLRLSNEQLDDLYLGAYLHDVGKIGIPDAVLLKPGRLTEAEFEIIKQHTVIGERRCGNLRSLRAIRPIVRHHHERLNGMGYPDGLQGDDIPLLAQVVGIVDVYDALTTKRPYRAPLSSEDARNLLVADVTNGERRRDLVEAFLALVGSGQLARRARAAISDGFLPRLEQHSLPEPRKTRAFFESV